MDIDFGSEDEEQHPFSNPPSLALGENPPYNVDNHSDIISKGLLEGRAIGADASTSLTVAQTPSSLVLRLNWSWVAREGHASRARRLKSMNDDIGGLRTFLAVKLSRTARPPHDTAREAALLARIDNPAIVRLLNAYLIPPDNVYHLFMRYYPLSLSALYTSSSFASSPNYSTLIRSLSYQAFSALDYIHHKLDPPIAHRDINPSNFAIDVDGSLVLLDFSVAINVPSGNSDSSLTEAPGKMHFELGTGSYRAPEILFASKDYDAKALDLWSLGVMLSEFYTPLEYKPTQLITKPKKSRRKTLFFTPGSAIILAGSIFKIIGTPTRETWPEANYLPDFGLLQFHSNEPVDLANLLTPSIRFSKGNGQQQNEQVQQDSDDEDNEPKWKERQNVSDPPPHFVDLIMSLLQISASRRITAKSALESHPFFQQRNVDSDQLPPLSLPASYPSSTDNGKSWQSLISPWLKPAIDQQMPF